MSHYVAYLTAKQPFTREPMVGAALFSASPARMQDGVVASRGTPSMVAYGSTREAALLSLRASLQAAVGAVECEILHRREEEDSEEEYVGADDGEELYDAAEGDDDDGAD